MLSHELGFATSWKMLTHERGWIVPLCLLALVGWIPILGQIVVLGYAYEWARFTAWGVDTAPRRHNIDYGKLFATGGRAFLILLMMGLAVRAVLAFMGFARLGHVLRFLPLGSGLSVSALVEGVADLSLWGIVALVVGLFLGTFLMAAMMRATLYDGFAAGWRVDRLCQMIARDPAGFCKVWLVSLIGSALSIAYTLVCAAVFGSLAFGGVLSYARHGGIIVYGGHDLFALEQLASWGAGPIIFALLLFVAALFFYGVISVAMQLVSVNAMGQWFCRFEVGRWGASADPLPEGVPAGRADGSARPASPVTPAPPSSDAASSGTGSNDAATSYWDDDTPVNV